MCTNCTVTRKSSDQVAIRPIVDRMAHSVLTTQEYPPPPIQIEPGVGTLSLTTQESPHWKFKFGQDLALWVLTTQ